MKTINRALVTIFMVVALTAVGCAQKPKGSYVDRVREVCGDNVAENYSNTKWKDRDYAHDAILVECMAFPEEDR